MPWWLWLVIILVALYPFRNRLKAWADEVEQKNKAAAQQAAAHRAATPYFWPVDEGNTHVAGTGHYQGALKTIAADHGNTRAEVYCIALLIPDPDNPHDDQAVRVEIDGATVGHLPRDHAASFRKRLARKKMEPVTTQCAARVWGGFDRNKEPIDYGVDLFIKPFPA